MFQYMFNHWLQGATETRIAYVVLRLVLKQKFLVYRVGYYVGDIIRPRNIVFVEKKTGSKREKRS